MNEVEDNSVVSRIDSTRGLPEREREKERERERKREREKVIGIQKTLGMSKKNGMIFQKAKQETCGESLLATRHDPRKLVN